MIYTASLDTLAKFLTTFVMAASLALLVFLYDSPGYVFWVAGTLLITGSCYMLRPMHYELYPDRLVIYRVFKPITIYRKDVYSVDYIPEKDRKRLLRLFGSGGFFGYFGTFWSKGTGRFYMQATRHKNLILIIQYTGNKYAITPDDEAFLPALKKLWRLP